MNNGPLAREPTTKRVDLELVAQRVLKLAEIAMLDHLEALDRSQAATMTAGTHGNTAGRRMCPKAG